MGLCSPNAACSSLCFMKGKALLGTGLGAKSMLGRVPRDAPESAAEAAHGLVEMNLVLSALPGTLLRCHLRLTCKCLWVTLSPVPTSQGLLLLVCGFCRRSIKTVL